ncbi:MAG: FG-GAP repeat domain-containing protein [Phycisphaerae bacterium]
MARAHLLIIGIILGMSVTPARGQWVEFLDDTANRIVAAPGVGVDNPDEKDYAWDDLDNDGDIDLVAVYKLIGTTNCQSGNACRRNALFMNEGIADGQAIDGVLVDRTVEYISNENGTIGVAGSSGFLDLTNDRDVAIADVNGDGWKDIITSTTLSGNLGKMISHPRIYINRGLDGGGLWLGFIFDNVDRVPTMPAEPRFCSVSTGDVDGDNDIDLYFGDYQQGGSRPVDLNDRLWINDGTGVFTDETASRMSFQMVNSSFGMATAIADMNGDGRVDIVKDTALTDPIHVTISYNNNAGATNQDGFFDVFDVVYLNSPYHISVGDLNGDGMMDIVITDDGLDRYILNQGNNASGIATFSPEMTFDGSSSTQFGGNSVIADLNADDFNDVLIANVDVDLPSCTQPSKIYRNLGDPPNVTLTQQGNVGIAQADLNGVHDFAVFDLSGDTAPDIVIGNCVGTRVYINQPVIGVNFQYPSGLPSFIQPNQDLNFTVRVIATGAVNIQDNTGTLHYSIDGGPFQVVNMVQPLPGGVYEATLPGAACMSTYDFFVQVLLVGGQPFSDPFDAPTSTFSSIASIGTQIALEDDIEGDVSGWTITSDPTVTDGQWEQAEPIGTIFNGSLAAPGEDAEASQAKVRAFVTQNCPDPPATCGGHTAGSADVDGGGTDLISPTLILTGTDADISYFRWFFTSSPTPGIDTLTVWVTGNGNCPNPNWVLVETVNGTSDGTNTAWEGASFRVSDFVTPTANVKVRFRAEDAGPGSVVEAGVDLFSVNQFLCSAIPDPCAVPGDMNANSIGDGADVQAFIDCLIGGGPSCGCADMNGSGSTEIGDVSLFVEALLLGGPCP